MNDDTNLLKDNLYILDREFESIYLLSEVIKDFCKYNAKIVNGADKMQILTEILAEKCVAYKKFVSELTPKIIKKFDEI